MDRFEVFFGPNTKQFWVYDSDRDAYIDPPREVLDKMEEILEKGDYSEDAYNEAETYLKDILNVENPPNWINDEGFIYDAEIDI